MYSPAAFFLVFNFIYIPLLVSIFDAAIDPRKPPTPAPTKPPVSAEITLIAPAPKAVIVFVYAEERYNVAVSLPVSTY